VTAPAPRWMAWLPAPLRRRLEGREGLQRFAANSGWLVLDKVLRLGLALAVGVWVARYLGPLGYGTLNYALALVGLFGSFTSLGLDTIVVRELVAEPGRRDEVMGSALALRALSALLATALVLAYILIFSGQQGAALAVSLVMASTLFWQPWDLLDVSFQARMRSRQPVLMRNLAGIAGALLRGGLVLAHAPVWAFAAAAVSETALAAALVLAAYAKDGGRPLAWRPDLGRMRRLLKDSWPMMLAAMAIMVYMRIDQVMLKSMVGDAAVGVYAAALKVSEAWYFIPMALTASAFPSQVRARERGAAFIGARLRKSFNLMAMLGYAVALPLSLLARPLVGLLYGPGFAEAGPILAVHVWAGLFLCIGLSRDYWLVGEKRTELALMSTLLGAAVNVGLNLWLIPRYGGLGAAWATVAAQAFYALGFDLMHPLLRPVFVMQSRALLLAGLWGRAEEAKP